MNNSTETIEDIANKKYFQTIDEFGGLEFTTLNNKSTFKDIYLLNETTLNKDKI